MTNGYIAHVALHSAQEQRQRSHTIPTLTLHSTLQRYTRFLHVRVVKAACNTNIARDRAFALLPMPLDTRDDQYFIPRHSIPGTGLCASWVRIVAVSVSAKSTCLYSYKLIHAGHGIVSTKNEQE